MELASDFWSTVQFFVLPLPKGCPLRLQQQHDELRSRDISSNLHKLHVILHVFHSPSEIPIRQNLAFRALEFVSSHSERPIQIASPSDVFIRERRMTYSNLLGQASKFLHLLSTSGVDNRLERDVLMLNVALKPKGVDFYLLDVAIQVDSIDKVVYNQYMG